MTTTHNRSIISWSSHSHWSPSENRLVSMFSGRPYRHCLWDFCHHQCRCQRSLSTLWRRKLPPRTGLEKSGTKTTRTTYTHFCRREGNMTLRSTPSRTNVTKTTSLQIGVHPTWLAGLQWARENMIKSRAQTHSVVKAPRNCMSDLPTPVTDDCDPLEFYWRAHTHTHTHKRTHTHTHT